MENVNVVTKEAFFKAGFVEGKTFSVLEKEWRVSGHAIKRGISAKETIALAWSRKEVNKETLEGWLLSNGTDNDRKQMSYYRNRLEDLELAYTLGQANPANPAKTK